MHLHRRSLITGTAAATALGLLGQSAFAQAWPAKPLRIVVPYPPGGSSDIIARAISQPLSDALKQPVIVENKAGANGNVGAEFVAKSAPDGYTLLLCDTGALAISPSVYTKLGFDPSKDLRGTTMLAYSPHLLVVHPSVPANDLKELVALSKKSELNFAVTATGSAPHLAGVALERASGARWQYIPYKGVSKKTRMPLIGDVPTIAEQGVAGFESGTWQGALVPRGTPDAIVARLNTELVRIIRSPDIRARLAGQGAEVVTMSAAEQDRFFEAERARWAQVVSAANIKLD
jgi:tripartite-type tricarboxylate transporter receptor subunit TctC